MLLGRSLPKFLWAEAVSYATWLKNHLPSRAILGHTPHKLVHGVTPDLSAAREFGASCYVHMQGGGKLDARAEEAVFVRMDAESKVYQINWPTKHKVSVERNVVFAPPSVAIDVSAEGEYNPTNPSINSGQKTSLADAPPKAKTPPATPPTSHQPLDPPPAPRMT